MANILIVDDAEIIRISIRKHIENLGHTVISTAENGYEAIVEYKKHSPDLVLMDISMPEVEGIKNGIEALEEIISIDKNAQVVMVTSHGEQRLVMEAISKGSKGYILKPVTKDKFENILEKLEL
ncbi:response regulator [Arcobacter sp. 15-2]|uniref:response regulator n=1 Tax=Arcobacter sp. 15-2 TaxID=3374109 RepID=UPI00399C54BC